MHFWRNYMPKLSVNLGNHISQNSHKNQYPGPVCNFCFTASKYSDKCWSNLPLKYHIFLIGNTHRSYCITCTIIWFMLWLVCLEPVTVCWWGRIKIAPRAYRSYFYTITLLELLGQINAKSYIQNIHLIKPLAIWPLVDPGWPLHDSWS